ncbi:hypothetical protein Cob_v001754 [Colletotrichum orbiculare MAFF 240422]|uniref:Uncharacterized protein n=1 Tax=Colletotrichum orbiculare (strain 104-T / ATCC 96160 / CBS 514.97 / LARS 414 / MAFF 240422) TaxID=1213857 RepID=A0A484G5P7_COLOR|nr:hypothetical protein Cob_v001754 [Colletotrichum orbiculare MAFF 240422]
MVVLSDLKWHHLADCRLPKQQSSQLNSTNPFIISVAITIQHRIGGVMVHTYRIQEASQAAQCTPTTSAL